ncbi:MAG TPA: GH116 family glycosyl-hydrolase [Chthoniobacteraceae bacterium]|jgi:uncharacterized protein (DUF608 family)|nr:GH116 family glycosyl-hydrolase [Chthoniobacteraceae bacterium]
MGRRDFVRVVALSAAASALGGGGRVMAGPFDRSDFENLMPADKKLDPGWVKSLFARGSRTVYRGAELEKIGMPAGGLCSGQVYLGGDGRLWLWDIFNQRRSTAEGHYAHPLIPSSPLDQGFTLGIADKNGAMQQRPLDATGFPDVTFCGEYPIGFVDYLDPASPVAVSLEAFSPFTPLDADDSSLPATVMRFTIKNNGAKRLKAELRGRLENKVCLESEKQFSGMRRNRIVREKDLTFLECDLQPPRTAAIHSPRAPILFADFESGSYAGWTVEGTAFGAAPSQGAPNAEQRLSGFKGKYLANSWATGSDSPKGKLISPGFVIGRSFINFLIGGGNHPNQTCINLLVDGKVARTATGSNSDTMENRSWDVTNLAGRTAHIEIVDHESGGWGHIEIDQIEFADTNSAPAEGMEVQADWGSMVLALLEPMTGDAATAFVEPAEGQMAANPASVEIHEEPFGQKLMGSLARKLELNPGESETVTFVIAWYFPNLKINGVIDGTGRHYATRFDSAAAAARYLAANYTRLSAQTLLWHDTWYDSTLPYWLLDRTLTNISTLATSTAYRFANGRFYGWEGVGSCPGTCTHVWQYEQAMGRLFPELDILLRERADFNPRISFRSDGMIDHRGEFHAGEAIDGQTGTILRAYRDHQMSKDDSFLKRNWPGIRKATEWLMREPGGANGILTGAQHNTLDAEWYGPVAWLSGMYLASLRASEQMALEAGEPDFATRCRSIFHAGSAALVERLFNGEYFMDQPDPAHLSAINSGTGCEIDQVLGQSWAFQVGLGRILPEKETRTALQSLWRYNFSPNVGPYRAVNRPGRWFAMPGESGLLMCTFPRTDWDYEKAKGKGPEWAAGYFNECMNGFEHQVAGHMIWEGMVEQGLAIERAVHDRYHASRRNPWNEVECGDHYARSMASYGVFTAACGFEYHGPRGHIGFAPRLTPNHFKAAFTSAEGWGSFSQNIAGGGLNAVLDLKWGRLRLRTIALTAPESMRPAAVRLTVSNREVQAALTAKSNQLLIHLAGEAAIEAGQRIEISIS